MRKTHSKDIAGDAPAPGRAPAARTDDRTGLSAAPIPGGGTVTPGRAGVRAAAGPSPRRGIDARRWRHAIRRFGAGRTWHIDARTPGPTPRRRAADAPDPDPAGLARAHRAAPGGIAAGQRRAAQRAAAA
jgi:hypothetical protein